MRIPSFFVGRVFKRDLPDFFKNLALLVKSGIPINDALAVLGQEIRSGIMKKVVLQVRKQVEQGTTISKAFRPYQHLIGDLPVNLIQAGELNGTLEANLQYLADLLDRQRELGQRIQSALLYPEIVLVMAFSLGGGIAVFVLPKLIPLFESLNVELPFATQLLLNLSILLRDHGVAVILGGISIPIILVLLGGLPPVRWFYHTVSLRTPVLGRLFRDYQLALFCQIFGSLFRSGLTIKEALSGTAEAQTNVRYRNALRASTKRLSAGVPLAKILGKYPKLFPQHMVALIAVGESSGRLDESFAYLSEYYNREVDTLTKRLPVLIEPMLLMIIGVLVLFLAMALITPIYEITSGIRPRSGP